jgi:hypothetical protein
MNEVLLYIASTIAFAGSTALFLRTDLRHWPSTLGVLPTLAMLAISPRTPLESAVMTCTQLSLLVMTCHRRHEFPGKISFLLPLVALLLLPLHIISVFSAYPLGALLCVAHLVVAVAIFHRRGDSERVRTGIGLLFAAYSSGFLILGLGRSIAHFR